MRDGFTEFRPSEDASEAHKAEQDDVLDRRDPGFILSKPLHTGRPQQNERHERVSTVDLVGEPTEEAT